MENKVQRATIFGGIITSVVASACCIGPVIFGLLGISSAGLLSQMEPYRPILSVIAVLLIVVAFFLTYKKKKLVECREDSYCVNPKSYVWNKRLLWIATFLVFAFLTFPYWGGYGVL